MAYQAAVWQTTDAYLSSVDEETLAQVMKVRPFPDMPAHQVFSSVLLTHGHGHLGEICILRVLQGLPSSLI